MRKKFYRQAQKDLYCNIIGYGAYKYPDRILCRSVCQGKGSYGRNAEAFPAYRKRRTFNLADAALRQEKPL
ncbi:MAG: hypothetical protein ACLSG9_05640 [Eubacterium sp.]